MPLQAAVPEVRDGICGLQNPVTEMMKTMYPVVRHQASTLFGDCCKASGLEKSE